MQYLKSFLRISQNSIKSSVSVYLHVGIPICGIPFILSHKEILPAGLP